MASALVRWHQASLTTLHAAQAFSTRVAGLKRNLSVACRTIEAVKSWALKPALKCPR